MLKAQADCGGYDTVPMLDTTFLRARHYGAGAKRDPRNRLLAAREMAFRQKFTPGPSGDGSHTDKPQTCTEVSNKPTEPPKQTHDEQNLRA